MVKKLSSTISKNYEAILFFIATLLNLYPVLSNQYFPTLDGPAHLYNASIIKELMVNSGSVFSDYFVFNNKLVPNWSGHFILVFFQLFLPAFLAEKCLLLLYLVGLPYAFRSLVLMISPKNGLSSYLIFPFCYTSVFLLGFYNFSIGILLMLVIFRAWIKREQQKTSWKKFLLFFLLFLLIYLSHLVVFLISIGFLLGRSVYLKSYHLLLKKQRNKPIQLAFLKNLGFLLLTALLPVILAIQYFLNRDSFAKSSRLSREELLNGLMNMDSIIGFSYDVEKNISIYIFSSIMGLAILLLIKRAWLLYSKRILIKQHDHWLLAALVVLVGYFILPNETGGAGFVSVRLNLIFYLFLICWIAFQQINQKLLGLVVLLVLACNFKLTFYYNTVSSDLNRYVKSITECSKFIEYGSTVIPLNYSGHWLTAHFSNYLAVDKNLVVMDNYESTVDYFPLRWSGSKFPAITIGEKPLEKQECVSWLSNPYGNPEPSDYVFILGKSNEASCSKMIFEKIQKEYQLIYSNKNASVYKYN